MSQDEADDFDPNIEHPVTLSKATPQETIRVSTGKATVRKATPDRAAKSIQYVLRGDLWEVTCEWGTFRAEDLSGALSACADAFGIIEEGWER